MFKATFNTILAISWRSF